MRFGDRLREVMQEKEVSQKKLAEALSTTQQTVSRWVNGTNEPDFDTLLKLCVYLGEEPNYLLAYDQFIKRGR